MIGKLFSVKPAAIINGLAIYKIGSGEPVFVMPYPHAMTFTSIAADALTQTILETGRSVITFDPPGAYNSTRLPKVDMDEMIECTNETMNYFNIHGKIDFVGHSMGSFCALAYAAHNQEKVKRLVLVGSTSGWAAQRKWGIHKSWKWWRDKEYYQCRYWGTKIILGSNNLKTYNKLSNIVEIASYVDKGHVQLFPIARNDNKKPLPVRGKWLRNVRKYDLQKNLQSIVIPVLICVGQYDPQTPVTMSKELNKGLKNSKLIVFKNSGHSPFIEENGEFMLVINDFLNKPYGSIEN